MNRKRMVALLENIKNRQVNPLEVTRLLYQATFPRKPKRAARAYCKAYYRSLKLQRLEESVRAEKWNMEIRRNNIVACLKGERNHQTPDQIRGWLAEQELHYHALRKELWRRSQVKHEWVEIRKQVG